MKWLAVFLLTFGVTMAGADDSRAASHGNLTSAEPTFEFAKVNQNRVWRLNRNTGEIAVCSVAGDHLLCTTSADAMAPPAKTFAEAQAERRQRLADAETRRQAKRARDVEFMEKVFDLFKTLMIAALERDSRD